MRAKKKKLMILKNRSEHLQIVKRSRRFRGLQKKKGERQQSENPRATSLKSRRKGNQEGNREKRKSEKGKIQGGLKKKRILTPLNLWRFWERPQESQRRISWSKKGGNARRSPGRARKARKEEKKKKKKIGIKGGRGLGGCEKKKKISQGTFKKIHSSMVWGDAKVGIKKKKSQKPPGS